VTLHADHSVSLENIPAHRKAKAVKISVPGHGQVTGDVAWGGNWFFFVEEHDLALELANVEALTAFAWAIRQAVNAQGFPEVDHIVLLGPPGSPGADGRSFVQCPGKAYDRSPCGTGTSARLACLAADGRLAEGAELVQESIVGSSFRGSFRWVDRERGIIVPTITGTAHVTAEATLLLDERDPFCWGIR
jgi:proline racemase